MSDQRLRELEATWRASGSVEDEAAWLLERVRLGEILGWLDYSRLAHEESQAAADVLQRRLQGGLTTPLKLRLAASLGHAPACRAIGESTDPWDLESSSSVWLRSLEDWDREALQLGETRQPDEGRIRAAIAVISLLVGAEGLTDCQGEQVRAAVYRAEQEIAEPSDEFFDAAFLYPIARRAGEDVYSPARCLIKCFVDAELGSGWPQSVLRLVVRDLGLATPSDACAAVQADLVPWALGYSDPVRDRVEARQQEPADE